VGDVDMIVTAIIAGATAGVTETASSAVKESYAALRKVVHDKLAARGSKSAGVLVEAEAEPGAKRRLRKQLILAGADRDEQVIAAARNLLALLPRPDERRTIVTVDNSSGFIIGDHNTLTQNVD
jgi:hypothetical protein